MCDDGEPSNAEGASATCRNDLPRSSQRRALMPSLSRPTLAILPVSLVAPVLWLAVQSTNVSHSYALTNSFADRFIEPMLLYGVLPALVLWLGSLPLAVADWVALGKGYRDGLSLSPWLWGCYSGRWSSMLRIPYYPFPRDVSSTAHPGPAGCSQLRSRSLGFCQCSPSRCGFTSQSFTFWNQSEINLGFRVPTYRRTTIL